MIAAALCALLLAVPTQVTIVDGLGTKSVIAAPGTATQVAISIQGVAGGTAIPISGSITASNPSVSTTAAAVPSSATYVGANKSGNLVGLTLDGSGNLNVNVAAGGGAGGTSSSFGAAFPASGTAIGAKDSAGTNMAALNLDASGNLKVNVAAGGAAGGTSSSFGAAFPATGTAAGWSDGTNMQGPRVFDADSGAGTQYVAGVLLRLSGNGGSVEGGTSANPIRVDTTGTTTQPVSAASLPLPTGASTAAKQPALGTAGTPSADVITVQGVSGGTPFPNDGVVLYGTTVTLAGNASVNTGTLDLLAYTSYTSFIYADVASATNGVLFEVSTDGATWITATSYTHTAGNSDHHSMGRRARYARITFTNGAAAQTAFQFSVIGQRGTAPGSSVLISEAIDPGDSARLTRSVITGVTTGGGGGYVNVKVNPSGAVQIDGSGVTQPISAASLPLPTGAATAAKQPALGTAGTASADVITIQGIASMTAVKVDGSAVTQPVSGTVTATAVGNVASGAADSGNPVKVGGVFNTVQPTVTNGQRVDAQMTARGGTIVATGADTFNVTVNAALPTGANTIGAVTQASGPWTMNLTQVAGSAVATGNGTAAGSVRVSLASDSTGQVDITDGTNAITIKAASTAPATTDTSLVVAQSPNPNPVCTSVIAINQTASTDIKTSTNKLHICSIVLVSATAQSISLVEGTGSTCATGTAALIGGTSASMSLAANGGFSAVSDRPWLRTATSADHLCLLQSGAGNISGIITYVDAT